MENPKTLIMGELTRSGGPSPVTPLLLELNAHRITPERDLPKMKFLFRMFGVECFPRGELVAVAGKAKSGKTFFTSLLMAACLTPKVLELERHTDPTDTADVRPLRVLWYDTEQSEQSTQDILVNRILQMAQLTPPWEGVGEALYAVNVRCKNWEERLQLFTAGVAYLKPDLVVLDGVRDLIGDINDGVEAQRITETLMRLAQTYQCCIVCVLHQNKGESDRNLRGWIGTELTNKVFEVYSCEKLKGSALFKVEQTHTRKHDIGQELYYTVNSETGLPEVSCKPSTDQPRDAQGRWVSMKSTGADNVRTLFTTAFEGRTQRPYAELMAVAMKKCGVADAKAYYAAFAEAVELGIVRKLPHPVTGVEYVEFCESQLPF